MKLLTLLLPLLLPLLAHSAYEAPGFSWKSTHAEVFRLLEKQGLSPVELSGPQPECLPDYQTGFGYHAELKNRDRGTRLRVSRFPYMKDIFQADFVFDKNAKLKLILLRRDWDKSVADARAMIDSSHRIALALRESFGVADDTTWDEDWIDTSRWYRKAPANLNHYLRGEKGFLFSPSFESCLGLVFSRENLPELPWEKPYLFAE